MRSCAGQRGDPAVSFELVSFEFTPRGDAGWTSGRLVFGEFLTLVRGPNDSGKTPVMKGIAYALGNVAELPAEVRAHCSAAVLQVRSPDGSVCRISRDTSRSYPVTVSNVDADRPVTLDTAEAFSEWWLAFSGIPKTALTSKSHQATIPYVSILLPFFWVDQDTGWRYLYAPHHTQGFVLNQEQEITRLMLGLAPRRVFRSRDEYNSAKRTIESLEAQVEARKRTLDNLRRESEVMRSPSLEVLEAEKQVLIDRLRGLQSAADAVSAGARDFDPLLADTRSKHAEAVRRAAYLTEQKRRIDEAANEISGDAELMSHNVTAQQAFRRFCGHDNCRLFAETEASSYGRRLLYLGDQMKDLRMYAAGLESDIAAAEDEARALKAREADVEGQRTAALGRSGLDNYILAVDAASKELAALDIRAARIREFLDQQRKFEALLQRLESARATAEELRPGGGRSETAGLEAARASYQTLAKKWLSILHTDAPAPLVSDEFKVQLGADTFAEDSPHSGSTRTRIVLGLHAAMFETSLSVKGHHPRVLLLDAPKQQEIAEKDLVAFVEALRALRDEYRVKLQVVLAVVHLDLDLHPTDIEWKPPFVMDDEPRYLGTVAQS